jgi:hypothetical protein
VDYTGDFQINMFDAAKYKIYLTEIIVPLIRNYQIDMGSIEDDMVLEGYYFQPSQNKFYHRYLSQKGVVILPFHAQSFLCILSIIDILSSYFAIRFVEVPDISGKYVIYDVTSHGRNDFKLSQLGIKNLGDIENQATSYSAGLNFDKDRAKNFLRLIPNFQSVKFIELMVLRKYHPLADETFIKEKEGFGSTFGGLDFCSSLYQKGKSEDLKNLYLNCSKSHGKSCHGKSS